MPCGCLDGAQETETHSRARGSCHVFTSPGQGVTILLVLEPFYWFSKLFWVVLSPMDIGKFILLKLSYVNIFYSPE